ncbi:coiled-coil domain-containing protein 189 [Scomber japonicus]|uniref:coiled-coil domain-containing protein 189 n=1 Tax=Scomber japonicus TaxID=13676 RepID=UPI0023068FE4|nr:coiled-coil domain-containing protein 189 [Scomber japonicus]
MDIAATQRRPKSREMHQVPRALKAKVMLWTDVSYHDMEEIDKKQSIPDLESILCSVFGVDLPEPRRGVLLELYVQTVLFCRECSFKKEQTSALLSIINSIHGTNVETPLNNLEQCFEYCKELLLCHSVRRPPFSINLFSSEEVNCIFNYIHNSYMRHYKLYKYIFTPQVKLDLSLSYSGIPIQHMNDSSAPDSKYELKALIEQEVREQMMLVSGQLDQRVKEIADQHNSALHPVQPNHKAKK